LFSLFFVYIIDRRFETNDGSLKIVGARTITVGGYFKNNDAYFINIDRSFETNDGTFKIVGARTITVGWCFRDIYRTFFFVLGTFIAIEGMSIKIDGSLEIRHKKTTMKVVFYLFDVCLFFSIVYKY
jgi:hypothetical protein